MVQTIEGATTMTTVTCVFNGKGGVGKTETTKALATEDARAGQSVLVIGLDTDCCITDALLGSNVGNSLTMYDVLTHPTLGMVRAIQHYTRVPLAGRLDVIPESMDLNKAPKDFLNSPDRPNGVPFLKILYWLLRQPEITGTYQRVYLDMGPNWDDINAMALIAAVKILIPATPEPLAIQALKRLKKRIEQNNLDRVSAGVTERTEIAGVVLTRVGSNAHQVLAQRLMVALAQSQPPMRCFTTMIPNSDAVWQSTGECLPVWAYAPNDPATAAYGALHTEVQAVLNG
jgi:chromosome partitioning protein